MSDGEVSEKEDIGGYTLDELIYTLNIELEPTKTNMDLLIILFEHMMAAG